MYWYIGQPNMSKGFHMESKQWEDLVLLLHIVWILMREGLSRLLSASRTPFHLDTTRTLAFTYTVCVSGWSWRRYKWLRYDLSLRSLYCSSSFFLLSLLSSFISFIPFLSFLSSLMDRDRTAWWKPLKTYLCQKCNI